jgi:hypothetical protein
MRPKNNEAMDERQWLEDLRQHTDGGAEVPPEDWWGGVERRMNDKAAASKRRRVVFGWIGSGAVAVAAVALVFVLGGDATLPVPVNYPATGDIAVNTPAPVSGDEPVLEPIAAPEPIASRRSETPSPETMAPAPTEPEPVAAPDPEPRQPAKPSTEATLAQSPIPSAPEQSVPRDPGPLTDPFTPRSTRELKRDRWQTGLFASNVSSVSSNGDKKDPSLIIGSPLFEPDYEQFL